MAKADRPDRKDRPDLFDLLPTDVRDALVAAARRRRYQAGMLIYQQDTPGREMFRIVSGAVRLYHLGEDGHEFVHAVYEPGDSFGVSSLIDGQPRAQMAQAQVDTVVEVITAEVFEATRERFREFDRALLLLLIGDVRILIRRVNSVAVEPLPSRLAWRILKSARPDEQGALVARLPQSELAAMVDASRQRVNTLLRGFEGEGLLVLGYGAITVTDRVGLSAKVSKP